MTAAKRPIIVLALLAATVVQSNVTLKIDLPKTTVGVGEHVVAKGSIINGSRRSLHLIDVLDGSAWHWCNPKVGWSIVSGDEKHPATPPKLNMPRCGNVNPLVPENFFTLEPGKDHRLAVEWAPVIFEKAGIYRVKFHYQIEKGMELRKLDGPSTPEELRRRYLTATPVNLVSNEVTVTVR